MPRSRLILVHDEQRHLLSGVIAAAEGGIVSGSAAMMTSLPTKLLREKSPAPRVEVSVDNDVAPMAAERVPSRRDSRRRNRLASSARVCRLGLTIRDRVAAAPELARSVPECQRLHRRKLRHPARRRFRRYRAREEARHSLGEEKMQARCTRVIRDDFPAAFRRGQAPALAANKLSSGIETLRG